MTNIWMAAGGTGGHISPCVAVAENLPDGTNLLCFTLEKNLDYPDIRTLPGRVLSYPAKKIPRSPGDALSFFLGFFRSLRILSREQKKSRPDAILAFGGYPSFPILAFAQWKKIPYFLFEQNSRPGMVTRVFRKNAKGVFYSFPRNHYGSNEHLTGNPVRRQIREKYQPGENHRHPRSILITGGSQGARHLNQLYQAMIRDPYFDKIKITLSAGEKNLADVSSQARKSDAVYGFIEDMHNKLNECDLVICRSGSGTVFENLVFHKPAIYFPYPHATDNHQYHNAAALQEAGVCAIVQMHPFNAMEAAREVKAILEDPEIMKNARNPEWETGIPLDAHQSVWEIMKGMV